jgi:uncharacterized protein (TIGR02266 family)
MVLGVTLIACGSALFALTVRRQAEMLAAMTPMPATASLAARALSHRAYVDWETWAEGAASTLFLVVAGTLLAARSQARRSDSSSADRGRLVELERDLTRAAADQTTLKTKLADAEASAAHAHSLLVEQRAQTDRELEALHEQVRSLVANLQSEKEVTGRSVDQRKLAAHEVKARANGGVQPENTDPDGNVMRVRLAKTPADPPRAVASPSITAAPVATEAARPSRRSSYPELRTELRFSAHVEVDFESDSHFYTGLTENLSEGGLFVATYTPRPVGSEIDLTLKLPGQADPIRAKGTVRWVREFSETSDAKPGMGLRLAMIDHDLPRVRRFLSTRPPLFFDDE